MTNLMNLTATQVKFCDWLYMEGNTDPNACVFSRAYLRAIAIKHGMAWAPAWIVKDKSRVTTRGLYRVPELEAYINNINAMNMPAETNTNTQ